MPIKWQPYKGPRKPSLRQFPFGDDNFGADWPSLLPGQPSGGPAVDIYQDRSKLYVEISLGGMKPEDVEISIEDDILTVQGKSSAEQEIKKKDYLRREIRKGSFKRVIKLPLHVKGKQASAEFQNGILKVVVPKASVRSRQATKIPIRVK